MQLEHITWVSELTASTPPASQSDSLAFAGFGSLLATCHEAHLEGEASPTLRRTGHLAVAARATARWRRADLSVLDSAAEQAFAH